VRNRPSTVIRSTVNGSSRSVGNTVRAAIYQTLTPSRQRPKGGRPPYPCHRNHRYPALISCLVDRDACFCLWKIFFQRWILSARWGMKKPYLENLGRRFGRLVAVESVGVNSRSPCISTNPCTRPTPRSDARLDQSGRGSPFVHLLCEVGRCAECMAHAAARLKANGIVQLLARRKDRRK